MKWVTAPDFFIFLFASIWLVTCQYERARERDCMMSCTRPLNECETVCDR